MNNGRPFPEAPDPALYAAKNLSDALVFIPGDKIEELDWVAEGPDVVVWHNLGLALRFSRFHESKGDLTAMVRIYTRGVVGYQDKDLYDAKIILTGSRSKTDAVKACQRAVPDWPYWTETVDRACRIVRKFLEEGTPPVDISLGDDTPEPPWLLEPLFRESENALLFGDGGTGKSTLALWFLLQMAPQQRVLYLDFEDSEPRMRRHLHAIARGMGMDEINRPVMYKQADMGLPQMAEALYRHIADAKIKGMVVDSAAMACGVEPEKAEAAIAYFRAIRMLHLDWTITIAHQPKEKEKSKYPFGSVFWWNTPRNIWQTRKSQEPGTDTLHVGLWHQKANNGPLQQPIGYVITRPEGAVQIVREQPRSVSAFRGNLSQTQRILGALEDAQGTALSYQELAEYTEIPAKSLYVILPRMGNRVAKKDGGFVLADFI
jgi:hypothetical protein